MNTSKYFTEAEYELTDIYNMNQFPTRCSLRRLEGSFQRWNGRMACDNLGPRKWIFVLRTAAYGKLYTRDGLRSWGVTATQCAFCVIRKLKAAHLFFLVKYLLKCGRNYSSGKVYYQKTKELGCSLLYMEGKKYGSVLMLSLAEMVGPMSNSQSPLLCNFTSFGVKPEDRVYTIQTGAAAQSLAISSIILQNLVVDA
ncbi:hypothetical protein BC332_18376 [Capsicum chinense]|nr:hypothetical protein BC332_18376 [Capsicum chinense]